ncbi:hypothetical protein BZA05DRAFT_338899, partial [Tricharina praecox]|uniref:uncharacterized protein n=1 Tax=Tricharina praecox TaxID=43433 RepID=UPI002220FEF3
AGSAVAAETTAGPSNPAPKGKAKAEKKPAKKKRKRDFDDESDADDVDFNPDFVEQSNTPNPGQITFCAECESRFTVTAYTCAAQEGDGMLCSKCGSKYGKAKKTVKKKRTTTKKAKRDNLRNALDNNQACMAKSLKDYCIEYVARGIDQVDDFGGLPERFMDRICQIISRNRSLTNHTMRLFLENDKESEKLTLYDCAKIDSDNLRTIGAFLPHLRELSLHHCGKMTDEVLPYYAEKLKCLESLHIRGAFLVSAGVYAKFFETVGPRLKSLSLTSTARTNSDVFEAIAVNCPNLKSLCLSHLARLDDDGVLALENCPKLKSLDISFAGGGITDASVISLLDVIGSGLEELNLSGNMLLTQETLDAIHACCAHLRVLNLNDCELLTDLNITNLFTNWDKNRGLREFHIARPESFGDAALLALATHSGQTLEMLDLTSCGDITKHGLLQALPDFKKLRTIDVGFIRSVDDEVVEAMQERGITHITIWGCTKVTLACKIDFGVTIVGREADLTFVEDAPDVTAVE